MRFGLQPSPHPYFLPFSFDKIIRKWVKNIAYAETLSEIVDFMKELKFSEPLPNLVLDGSKDTTWRVGDQKNIIGGDLLSLRHSSGEEFAKAEVLEVRETTFGELTEQDKDGHESFSSDEEMYQTYSGYYGTEVTPKTKLKVIKFRPI